MAKKRDERAYIVKKMAKSFGLILISYLCSEAFLGLSEELVGTYIDNAEVTGLMFMVLYTGAKVVKANLGKENPWKEIL
jgi:membrane protein CcdC involved in cytochrome C biogenesis